MFTRFSRSSKLKNAIKPDPESISYFQVQNKTDSGYKNLCAIEMTSDSKVIVGTQKGDLLFYILDQTYNLRSLYKPVRIQKGEVHRIFSLFGADTILVHIKNSMYLHYSQSGKSENLSNSVSSFRVWKKEGKILVYLAENRQIRELDLTKKSVDSSKKIIKGNFWTFEEKVQKFMVNDKIVLAFLTNNTLIMKNSKNKSISHDYKFPLTHLMLHPLDRDIFLIILENQKYNLGICGNSKGGMSTKYQQTFDLTHTLRVSSVVDDGFFVVISTGNIHNIFSKKDGKMIQMVLADDEAKEGRGYTLALNPRALVVISEERNITVMKPESIDVLVGSSLTKKTYKTLVSLVNTVVRNPKEAKSYTCKIYQDFALKSLYNRQYDEAKESLSLYRFDPKEILEQTIEDYLPGQSGALKSYSKDMRIFVLNLMRETRDSLLLKGENYYFTPDKVTRIKPTNEGVSAAEWLCFVDFAVIRSFYGLGKFDDLFDFLRTKDKIYCADVEDLKGLLFDVTNNDMINSFLQNGILSELHFLFGDFASGLQALGKLNQQFSITEATKNRQKEYAIQLAKYKPLFKYTFDHAISVLTENEKQPNFLAILTENLLWLRTNKQKMQDLFSKLTFDEQSIKEMKKQIEKILDQEVKLSIYDVFLGKLFETEGINQVDINSEFLIKNFNSLSEKSTKIGYERALKILQDETRVFDYYKVYDEFLKFQERLSKSSIKKDLQRLMMMIQVEILKNLDKLEYHKTAIQIMLEKEEYEMAELYCARYEASETENDVLQETDQNLGNDNYFGMYFIIFF